MTLREYLRQTKDLDKLIQIKKKQLRHLRERRDSIGAPATPDKIHISPKNDRMAELTVCILDLIDLLVADVTKLLRFKFDIERLIEKLDSISCRLIMTERYINLKRWEDIAADNKYSLNTVHRLHSKALRALEIVYANSGVLNGKK